VVGPDLFITIAFCAEVALFGIAGGLLVWHEWRREAVEATADRRELALLRTGRVGYPASAAKPPTIAP
jgi:hypothetical protein